MWTDFELLKRVSKGLGGNNSTDISALQCEHLCQYFIQNSSFYSSFNHVAE